jgi:hypothetical protein
VPPLEVLSAGCPELWVEPHYVSGSLDPGDLYQRPGTSRWTLLGETTAKGPPALY